MIATPTIKVIALLRRKHGVSREVFLRQWEEKHGPLLARSLPGLRTLIQNRAIELPPHGEPPIDGFDEMWIDDLPAYRRLGEFYRGDAGSAIRDHEETFLDRGAKPVFAVDQKFIVNRGGAVKVMNYVTRKEGTTREQFFRHWEAVHGPLSARLLPWFRTYVQDHIVPLPNLPAPPFDGLDEMWVDDLESWKAVFEFYQSAAGKILRDDEAQFSTTTAAIFLAEPRVVMGSAEAQWGKR
ncbi:MAG: EthD family reductase [Candidatus Binatia bacterium]